MGTFEKEVKILSIDKKKIVKKLNELNFEFIGVKNQKIYTYDIMSIYSRYIEIKELLKSKNKLIIKTSIKKLEVLLDEFSDLVSNKILNIIYEEMCINSFNDLFILERKNILKKLNSSQTFKKNIKNMSINPNKWIRLRQSNDKIELTLKHIYEKNNDKIQKVKEIELNVSSLNEMNNLLEASGIVKRNYQEKIRTSYKYKDASVEIDEWPLLDTYIEVECNDSDTINEIINLLELNDHEIVSLNTQELYRRKNINILEKDELKF